jgi:hypothetical protein
MIPILEVLPAMTITSQIYLFQSVLRIWAVTPTPPPEQRYLHIDATKQLISSLVVNQRCFPAHFSRGHSSLERPSGTMLVYMPDILLYCDSYQVCPLHRE